MLEMVAAILVFGGIGYMIYNGHQGRKDGRGSERTDPASTYYSNTYNTEFWFGILLLLTALIFLIIFSSSN